MRVTYFDEVKANPQNGQDFYFVGGLSIPSDKIADLELKVNDLAEQYFGTRALTPTTEFHAAAIYNAKAHFKGWEVGRRLDLLEALGKIIAEADEVKRVYAAINSQKIYNSAQAPEIAFAFFCERVQLSLRGSETLLIGDHDDQYAKEMITAFHEYRANGTPYPYGIELTGLLDAVHFARSHHSRLLQLADSYLFLETHGWGTRKGWMAENLSERLKPLNLYPHRYKHWPNK